MNNKVSFFSARLKRSVFDIIYYMNEELLLRARKIKVILTDVDGIWTDGKINFYVDAAGKIAEFKSFNVLDGIASLLCNSAGITTGVITGRRHEITVARCRSLGVKYIYQGFLSKLGPLHDICKREGVSAEEVAYIGDDLTDVPLLEAVGLAVSVPDALQAAKDAAHYITARGGGEGAYREATDLILQAQGKLTPLVSQIKNSQWNQKSSGVELQIITSQEGIG